MSWLLEPLFAIVALGLLIFVHELGHFLVAKWCGVGVVKFAVGFGPAILRFRKAETDYQLGCIPLGGFVRMVGDMPDMITGEQETDNQVRQTDEPSSDNKALEAAINDRSRWFIEKKLWQRSAIVFAGPLFNFVFAFLVVALAVLLYGRVDESATIGGFTADSPAQMAGLAKGDRIVAISGEPITGWIKMAQTISTSDGSPLQFEVFRDGQSLSFEIDPKAAERVGPTGERTQFFAVGISPSMVHPGVFESLYRGAWWTVETTLLTYQGLWQILTGQISAKDGLAGPVTIYKVAVQHAEQGLKPSLLFLAFVSVSLAAINLLPIPVLDGGHLLFFLLEGIFGPLSIRKKEVAQQVGLLLILFLMVFAIHNDFTREPLEQPKEDKIEWKDEADSGN